MDFSFLDELAEALGVSVEKLIDMPLRQLIDLAFDNDIDLDFSLVPIKDGEDE